MEKKNVIGVDVSKKTLDVCLMEGERILEETRIGNSAKAVRAYLRLIRRRYAMEMADTVVCAEHTGQYTYHLRRACEAEGFPLCLENPMQIRLSMGVRRGKSDRADARRIAGYALRAGSALRLCGPEDKRMERLRQLYAERRRYARDIAKYKGQLRDQGAYMDSATFRSKSRRLESVIAGLEEAKAGVEDEMDGVISSSGELSWQMRELRRIPGVGRELAMGMIVVTRGFTRFDNARQFLCYAGLAPFDYTSGTSVRSRRKVSRMADRGIKWLLHMGALAVARSKGGDMKEYYLRKVAEGKNKMSVLNALRAKIAFRMFSVAMSKHPYREIYTPIYLQQS